MITIEQARETLGIESKHMSDPQVTQILTMMQLLVEMAFDLYEKQVFGQVVSRLRHGKVV